MIERITHSTAWNWAWWLVSLAAIGVIAWHIEYGNRWVRYALNVVVITWIVPYKTPRLRPYGRGEALVSMQQPEQLIARMLRLLDDADDSNVMITRCPNTVETEFEVVWWDEGDPPVPQSRLVKRSADNVWRVSR